MMDAVKLSAWIAGPRAGLDTRALRRAVAAALEAHEGQLRESGAPAVTHPLNVARWVALTGGDVEATTIAVLHDVPEDTPVGLREVAAMFGPRVADAVALLTKPCRGVPPPAMERVPRERASAAAWRALHVKVADRLDNMLSVAALPQFRRRKLARETLDVLCPLAARIDARVTQMLLCESKRWLPATAAPPSPR